MLQLILINKKENKMANIFIPWSISPSVVSSLCIVVGAGTFVETIGVKLDKHGDSWGSPLKVIGQTVQNVASIPAIIGMTGVVSLVITSIANKIFTTPVGSTRFLWGTSSLVTCSVFVLTPLVATLVQKYRENKGNVQGAKAAKEFGEGIGVIAKVLNMAYLTSLVFALGMTAPLAVGIALSLLSFMPLNNR